MNDKVKIPIGLSLQLVTTTDWYEYAVYLHRALKKLSRKRQIPKAERQTQKEATLRILRRVVQLHAVQLRERTRALETFCILKAQLREKDWFDDTDRCKIDLATEQGICLDTFNSRLNTLEELKLIERSKRKVKLCTWEKVCEVFKLPVPFRIPFYWIKPCGKKISLVLKQKRMQEKEKQCERTALYKLNNCSELVYQINCLSGKKPSLSALRDIQLQVQRHPHLIDQFGLDDWIMFNVCRPESSISYRFWSVLFGYRSKGGFAYCKRQLKTAGLMEEETHRTDMPKGLYKSAQYRSNSLGTIIWDTKRRKCVRVRPNTHRYLSANLPAPAVK